MGGSVQRRMDAQLIELNKKSRNIERLCKDVSLLVAREDLFEPRGAFAVSVPSVLGLASRRFNVSADSSREHVSGGRD
jgi:hypothetical protein